jgi:hypothetical protein
MAVEYSVPYWMYRPDQKGKQSPSTTPIMGGLLQRDPFPNLLGSSSQARKALLTVPFLACMVSNLEDGPDCNVGSMVYGE